jgi:hypothetical protein
VVEARLEGATALTVRGYDRPRIWPAGVQSKYCNIALTEEDSEGRYVGIAHNRTR